MSPSAEYPLVPSGQTMAVVKRSMVAEMPHTEKGTFCTSPFL